MEVTANHIEVEPLRLVADERLERMRLIDAYLFRYDLDINNFRLGDYSGVDDELTSNYRLIELINYRDDYFYTFVMPWRLPQGPDEMEVIQYLKIIRDAVAVKLESQKSATVPSAWGIAVYALDQTGFNHHLDVLHALAIGDIPTQHSISN